MHHNIGDWFRRLFDRFHQRMQPVPWHETRVETDVLVAPKPKKPRVTKKRASKKK